MSDPQPKWRKVLVSGSNAHVAALTASAIANTHGDAQSPGVEEQVLVYNTSSGAIYYTGSFGTGGSGGGGNPASPDKSVQFNNSNAFGGSSGFIFDSSQDASLFVDGPITGSNISGSGVISGSTVVATSEFKLAKTSLPVGIIQESVGGSATMEFTTTDGSGNQASRIVIRGNGDNPDIEFYTGASGSELGNTSTSGLIGAFGGDNKNFGIGNFGTGSAFATNTATSKFIVEGNITTTGSAGHITASGNISASNNIFASTSLSGSHANNNVVLVNTATGELYHTGSYGSGGSSVGTLQQVTDEGAITTVAITSSADISSSATIRGRDGFFTRDLTAVDDIFIGDRLMHYSDSTTTIGFNTDFIYFSASKLEFGGAITASSNISASNKISAEKFEVEGSVFADKASGKILLGEVGGVPTQIFGQGGIEMKNDLTGSIISASDNIFVSTSLSGSHTNNNVLLINTATGELYHTGSYGSGGGGGGAVTAITNNTNDNVLTATGGTTINGEAALTFNTSNGLRVAGDAQFNYLQNGSFGGHAPATSYKAGQFVESSQLRTYVTPQKASQRMSLLGISIDKDGLVRTDENFIRFTSSIFFDPTTDSGGGHTGPGEDGTVGVTGRVQVTDKNEKTGITISGNPGIFFFNNDASSSVSGSFNFDSASAHIKFDTGSSGVQFLTGETTQALTQTLFLSQSSGNPSIGVGTTTPESIFDIQEVANNSTGTRILLKSARSSTEGAQVGDAAGSIFFAIDSASFANVFDTGSVAEITTEVTALLNTGNSLPDVAGNIQLKSSPPHIESLNTVATVGHFPNSYFNPQAGTVNQSAALLISGALLVDPYLAAAQGQAIALRVKNVKDASGLGSRSDYNDVFVITGSNAVFNSGSLVVGSGSIFLASATADSTTHYGTGGGLEFVNFRGQGPIKLGQVSSTGMGGSTQLDFYTGDTQRTRLDSSGNFGIGTGTRTLSKKLEVEGEISASGKITTTEVESPSDFTLDVEGDITLDANGADIILSDNGTDFGRFKRDTSDFIIKSETNNKDIVFKGVDDSSTITALTLDMSDAGKAIFNDGIVQSNNKFLTGTETDGTTRNILGINSSNVTQVANANIATNIKGTSITLASSVTASIISASGDLFVRSRTIAIPSTNGYNGDVVSFGNGPSGNDGNINAGELYYLSSSQNWELADADASSTATNMLGIAVADNTATFLVKGIIQNSVYGGFTTGAPLYVSTTAGDMTGTAPSGTGDIVRVVGYSVNGGSRIIYFNPSNDHIVHT